MRAYCSLAIPRLEPRILAPYETTTQRSISHRSYHQRCWPAVERLFEQTNGVDEV